MVFSAAICEPLCENGGSCKAPGYCQCTPGWKGLQCEKGKINPAVQTHFTQSGNSIPPQLCISQSVLMVNASTLVNATAMLVTKGASCNERKYNHCVQ